jgi:uncharacterized lipoprotein YddW (UPF0748 family)
MVSGATMALARSTAVEAVSAAGPPQSEGAVYLTDMSRCLPASALSRKPQRNRWRLLDYETDPLKGTMLVAGQNTAATPVTYPLKLKGWHAIYFGIRSYGYNEDYSRLLVRLKKDSTFSLISHRGDSGKRNRLDDIFWKAADLTGQDIVMGQWTTQVVPDEPDSVGNPSRGAWVAYIKLVPLTEEEVKQVKEDREGKKNRRLWAHNDAWSYHYAFRPVSEADIRREIEPFRDTDFSRMYWEAASGDRCSYFTKIGLMPSDDWIEDPYRIGDRLAAESWRILRQKNVDPFRVALDYCHEIGLEFHAAYRTAGFHFPVPHREWNSRGFYDDHPEWKGVDRQGRSTPRLSYAYSEVRQFVVSILKEVAGYPIDGVCLLYNRRPPLVEYEPPVVEGFQSKYGLDPRKLSERDPRWLSFRATFLTQFMREVREAMNQVGREQKRNKAPQVTAIVMSSREENLYYAMDLESWVREGLVDALIPYTSVTGLNSGADSWVEPRDARFFQRITRGTACRLALNLMPRQMAPEDYRRRAHGLYRAGIEHLFFWDTNSRNNFSISWDALRRLGHREELQAWAQEGSPKLERPGSTLHRLGEWDLSYATPG